MHLFTQASANNVCMLVLVNKPNGSSSYVNSYIVKVYLY